MSRAQQFAKRFRVRNGRTFRLKDVKPDDTWPIKSRTQAERWLERGVARLAQLQEKLYAQDSWGLLLIFQAMDAAGKDGTIKHVMSGVNPQGCQVYQLQKPVRRGARSRFPVADKPVPARARAYRHFQPLLLRGDARGSRASESARQARSCRPSLVTRRIWNERFEDMLRSKDTRHATASPFGNSFCTSRRKEQKRRFLRRLDLKSKNWKFSTADAKEREHWHDNMAPTKRQSAHERRARAVDACQRDHKWFTRLVVVEAVIDRWRKWSWPFPKSIAISAKNSRRCGRGSIMNPHADRPSEQSCPSRIQ